MSTLNSRVRLLDQRLQLCELALRSLDHGSKGPKDYEGAGEAAGKGLHGRVLALKSRLDAVFESDPMWGEYIERVKSVETWLHAEHATVSHLVMDRYSKRQFVLQHAGELRDFATKLKNIKEVFSTTDARPVEHLEGALRALQRQHEPLLLAAQDLYERVRPFLKNMN